jgi:hypothetical protein
MIRTPGPTQVAWNAHKMRRLQWKDLPGLAVVVAIVSFLLDWQPKHPDWQRPSGLSGNVHRAGESQQPFTTKSCLPSPTEAPSAIRLEHHLRDVVRRQLSWWDY